LKYESRDDRILSMSQNAVFGGKVTSIGRRSRVASKIRGSPLDAAITYALAEVLPKAKLHVPKG
jgi:ribosomal protein L22